MTPDPSLPPLEDLEAFRGLPAPELAWLRAHGQVEAVAAGQAYVHEGQADYRFYVCLEGELQITRTVGGQERVLGTTPPGVMNGEMSLLAGEPSAVTAEAILPSRLLTFDPSAFRQIFTHCPEFGARVFRTADRRTQGWMAEANQQEKMAALGKLAAGLAHELNNPAAAARRGADRLRATLPGVLRQALRLSELCLDARQQAALLAFEETALKRAQSEAPLSPVERSDREEAVAAWLESPPPAGPGLGQAWEIAPNFVAAGISLDELRELAGQIDRDSLPAVLRWLDEMVCAQQMLSEIDESTRRISDLVASIKEYTFMDQAAFQEVDLHKGLDSSLRLLGHKLGQIRVQRSYDPNLPLVCGRGSELNQVWLNLLDNAIDAVGEQGEITLATRCENDYVRVEIIDSGPGIPPELLARIFEPFYTTKEVGLGTGLGLDIAYRIVHQHHGAIEVDSRPGRTRFTVRLPVRSEDEP